MFVTRSNFKLLIKQYLKFFEMLSIRLGLTPFFGNTTIVLWAGTNTPR
jgi:hypothetical protein